MLFSDRNELLKLYNAINGTSYDDPDLLQVNTLENAIYPNQGSPLFQLRKAISSGWGLACIRRSISSS